MKTIPCYGALATLRPKALTPFKIVTAFGSAKTLFRFKGIDVIVKSREKVPVHGSELYYVEFKHLLSASFNHSFENLYSIVCWDTELKHGDIVRACFQN
jgi:hypothetical protein